MSGFFRIKPFILNGFRKKAYQIKTKYYSQKGYLLRVPLLVLEKTKTSKDGKAPITIRLTVDSKRVELSLGLKIHPEKWNQQAGMAAGSSIKARQINTAIERVKASLIRHYDILSAQHDYISAAMVKDAYRVRSQRKAKPSMKRSISLSPRWRRK